MADDARKETELVSLNDALMDCSFDQVSAEDLERRLELAVGFILDPLYACTGFASGSCRSNNCTDFYGGNCTAND
jgi:hypothetical protein